VKSLFWRPCSSRGPLKPGWQHFTQSEVNLQYAVGLSSKHLVDHQTTVTSGPAPVLAVRHLMAFAEPLRIFKHSKTACKAEVEDMDDMDDSLPSKGEWG
ncbi:hypothetical protein KUCAC02_026489, partial [Chaenocephalus aceratus]